jgi:hypothetical protein
MSYERKDLNRNLMLFVVFLAVVGVLVVLVVY